MHESGRFPTRRSYQHPTTERLGQEPTGCRLRKTECVFKPEKPKNPGSSCNRDIERSAKSPTGRQTGDSAAAQWRSPDPRRIRAPLRGDARGEQSGTDRSSCPHASGRCRAESTGNAATPSDGLLRRLSTSPARIDRPACPGSGRKPILVTAP